MTNGTVAVRMGDRFLFRRATYNLIEVAGDAALLTLPGEPPGAMKAESFCPDKGSRDPRRNSPATSLLRPVNTLRFCASQCPQEGLAVGRPHYC